MKAEFEESFKGTINGVQTSNRAVYHTSKDILEHLESEWGLSSDDKELTKEVMIMQDQLLKFGASGFDRMQYNVKHIDELLREDMGDLRPLSFVVKKKLIEKEQEHVEQFENNL
jgi:hypothetical protein